MDNVGGSGRDDGRDERITIKGVCDSDGRPERLQFGALARGSRQRRHLVSSCHERSDERDADGA
jgi:hypothetical protein